MTNSKETKNNNFPLDNDKITTNNLKNFPKKITNNITKYELYNVVPENGDSIYSPQYEEYSIFEKGQVFVSETVLEEYINRILDQRLGSSINNNKRNEH